MRVFALVTRILRQIVRDKRTLGLLIFAPILVLSMVYLVFSGNDYISKVGLVNVPDVILEQMNVEDAKVTEYHNQEMAKADLANQKIDGYVVFTNQSPAIFIEGSDPSKSGAVMKWIQANLTKANGTAAELKVDYLHGSDEMEQFDYFGPYLVGFFIFFFVFLIAGISFLRERTTGTLERLLSSPLRKWEIVVGYILGFGVFSLIQATIITVYAIYVLGMFMDGALIYVLMITFMLSLTALTLGTLLSAFANNEFQMMQFIPIVIIPQIFFSGLFNLETISGWLSWIGPFTPLYYAADALKNVMIRGSGWGDIYLDILALIGFSLIFVTLNIFALRKYRRI
ncbi:ABC transporter permease [Bacillus niameyensis]|uniref:ABC transporter permease n=1 Tax=Bacillus niameyensis TaxID=1522308 RepID=UPI000782AD84|nr:ABC transporter permease [Bacillus niameyensis]